MPNKRKPFIGQLLNKACSFFLQRLDGSVDFGDPVTPLQWAVEILGGWHF